MTVSISIPANSIRSPFSSWEQLGFQAPRPIADREDDYRKRRLNRVISPERNDAFAMGDKTPDARVRTYADVMKEETLKRDKEETLRLIAKKKQEEAEKKAAEESTAPTKAQLAAAATDLDAAGAKRRNRWDQSGGGDAKKPKTSESDWDAPDGAAGAGASRWDAATPARAGVDATPTPGPRRNRWDETPTPGRLAADGDATPGGGGATPAGMTWDSTPKAGVTPTPKKNRSRWDETPATVGGATPMMGGMTPGGAFTPGITPMGGIDMATPTPGQIALRAPMTPEQYNMMRWERDIEERNRPLSDEELDAMFPQDGYKVLDPPASYVPIRTPARKLLATPTPMGGATPLYQMPEEDRTQKFDVPGEAANGLPFMKPEDYQYFGALLNETDEEKLKPEESKERKIMKLLLKVKNGTPPQRKTALRQLTDKARELGAGALFNQILPLLMAPTLEDQERHLLVKVGRRQNPDFRLAY